MSKEISSGRKAQLWDMIQSSGPLALNAKEEELLSGILQSSTTIKALGIVYCLAQELPTSVMALDLSDVKNQHEASRCQGRIQGVMMTIESLLSLVTAPEEQSDD